MRKLQITTLPLAAAFLLLGSCLAPAQQTYTPSELKREQVKFKGYLESASTQLSEADKRLRATHNCELAVKETCAAYGYITLSEKKQQGHLDRIEKNSGLFPVSTAKDLTAKYQDIIKLQNQTEETANNFVDNILKANCPDYVSAIKAFRERLKSLDASDPDIETKIQAIVDGLNNASGIDPAKIVGNPEDLKKALLAAGFAPDVADKILQAWTNHNWDELARLLADCDTPLCQYMKDYAKKHGGAGTSSGASATSSASGSSGAATPVAPADPQAAALAAAGLDPATVAAVLEAMKSGNWQHVLDLLKNCNDPACQKLKQEASSHLGGGNKVADSETIAGEETEQHKFDFGDGRSGEAHGVYPNGKAKGILSEERWFIESGGQKSNETHKWEFEIDVQSTGDNKISCTVGNDTDNKQQFVIEEWELRKGGNVVQTGSGPKFDATYPDAGDYEIVAKGKTKPTDFSFKVYKTRSYHP